MSWRLHNNLNRIRNRNRNRKYLNNHTRKSNNKNNHNNNNNIDINGSEIIHFPKCIKSVEDSVYKIVNNPGIKNLIDELVRVRCTADLCRHVPARHCSAVFQEKNQSCFKSTIYWNKSRELLFEKITRKCKKKTFTSHTRQHKAILYRKINPRGRYGTSKNSRT